jgi:hypothetical protein
MPALLGTNPYNSNEPKHVSGIGSTANEKGSVLLASGTDPLLKERENQVEDYQDGLSRGGGSGNGAQVTSTEQTPT